MGYLFLILALFAGATKGFCGKKISGATKTLADASLVNFLRMALCIIIGAVLMLAGGVVPFAKLDGAMVAIAALSGISTAVFVVSWLVSVRSGAYVMLDVFLMLGVGVTVSCCRIFLGEAIRLNQIIGFVILILAAYIMCSYDISLNGKMSLGKIALLILCGVSNGLTDFSQKLFVYRVANGNTAEFNFYTYIFAAISLLLVFAFLKLRDRGQKKNEPVLTGRVIAFVVIMAVCLFLNSYFKTLAATGLDSAILYPVNQGAALILSLLMAAIFFKEKITVRCVVGISMAFVALLIINLL
jgi:drug/metabolite transporter (DMT)-like permease